jgi:NitT/TauT family transport system substrate-binding protein
MKRRSLLVRLGTVGSAAALAPWLGACGSNSPLRVSIHPWIGYETLRLAKAFKWLPELVHLVDHANLSDSTSALQAGIVDAACLTLDEVLYVRGLGVGLTVVLVFDRSEGANMVLAKSDSLKPGDLRGKRIGMERGALASIMLSRLLDFANLKRSDLIVIESPQERLLNAWQKNEIDLAITYEPTATALQRLGGKKVFDSSQAQDTIVDVLAFRTDRLHFSSTLMHGLVRGHFKGLAHLKTHSEDVSYRIATSQNMRPEEVHKALSGVVFPTLEANREYLAVDGRLMQSAKALSALMVREKLLMREDTLVDLVNAKWLPSDSV